MSTAHKYPVRATCIKTGATYKWPSIKAATLDTGFTYNAVKLAVTGQLESYAGLRWSTPERIRSPGPSLRIAQIAQLHQRGLTNRQMAAFLGLSQNTVKFNKQRAKHLGLITLRNWTPPL